MTCYAREVIMCYVTNHTFDLDSQVQWQWWAYQISGILDPVGYLT
jgi:hypothetical protein